MRKLIKLAIVAFGVRAFLRWRKSRHEDTTTTTATLPPPDPADELRRKLAESREDVASDPAPEPEASVAERRAAVHEQGRAALDEMKPSDEA